MATVLSSHTSRNFSHPSRISTPSTPYSPSTPPRITTTPSPAAEEEATRAWEDHRGQDELVNAPRASNVSEEVAGSIFDMYHSPSTENNHGGRPASFAGGEEERLRGEHDEGGGGGVIMGRLPRQGGEGGARRSSGAPSSVDSEGEGSGLGGGVAEAGRKLVAAREGGAGARNGPRPSDAGGQSVSSFTGSVRGEEEEEDSFHVRSTYARLDVVGVPGDGWEEGVERTRERSKLNRKSVARFGEEGLDGIDELEKKMRGTLDRYGFFHSPLATRSEHRIFAIPSPTLNAPKTLTPRKASTRPSSPTPPTMGEQPRDEAGPSGSGSTKGKRELARVAKWERMMVKKRMDQGGNVVAWDWAAGKGAKVSRRVYKGVPDRWRAAAWGTLIDQMQSPSSRKGKGRATDDELLNLYQVRIDQPSSFDVQIDLDVPRTISGHVLFHTRYGLGQRALFHSLHSFSLYCEDCGYCQGMGSIAANLLCYFSAERTYTLLVRLHDQYDLHSIFSPGFPGMLEAFYVQERILESMLPEVYSALKKEMISTSSYATKWYITLFSTTLPFHTQLRIWDAFFLEGQDLMIVVSVGILWAFRDNLHSKEASFETILSLLSSFFIPEDDDAFMAWVQATLALKGLRGKMDQWRGEWRGFVEQGVEMQKLM